MVATILIVAITVVLAAVLYFMIAALTRTTGAAPLGSQLAWGAPVNATGVSTVGCAAVTHYCYRITIEWAGSDFRISSLTLGLQNPTGVPVGWPASLAAAGGTVKLADATSGKLVANYWVANTTWQALPQFSGTIYSGYSLVLYAGGAPEGGGQGLTGLELVGIGSNGYSGTVASAPFS
jgi:hypothetical protein